MRANSALLIAIPAIAWIAVAWFELGARVSYYDDAFIYLASARNVLATGSAELFPLADGDALVASSPLRLLVLTIGYAAAASWHGSEACAALAASALLATGVTTTALGAMASRRTSVPVSVSCALAAGLCLVTNSMLQMEGALVFWLVLLLVQEHVRPHPSWRSQVLLCLLVLSRPELGLAATIASLVVRRAPLCKSVLRLSAVATAIAAAWCLLAACLGVWPIPTTYLSKVMTSEAGWFGQRFLSGAHVTFASYLPLPQEPNAARQALAAFAALVGWALWPTRAGRLAACTLATAVLLLARAPGNYGWYHENLLLAVLASLLAVTAEARARPRRIAVLLALLALVANQRLGHNDQLAWRLNEPDTYADRLRRVAAHHVGHGVFAFATGPSCDELLRCRISTWEIGMLAYFAGPDAWLHDAAGIAQPGQVPGATTSRLAVFYPGAVLTDADEQLERLEYRFGHHPLVALDCRPPTTPPQHSDVVLPELGTRLRLLRE